MPSALRDHPTLGPHVRLTPTPGLPIDNCARFRAEERLDGKFLRSTSDPHITPGDIALVLQAPARGRAPSAISLTCAFRVPT